MFARHPGVRVMIGLSIVIAWVGGSAPPAYADLTGNVNLFLGGKALNKDDWRPVEHQSELAVEFDFRERAWPINLVLGLRGAHDEAPGFEGTTSEFSIGIRKIGESFPSIRPFLGGGLSMIGAEQKGAFTLRDVAPGIWFGGGAYLTVSQHLNLGADLRVSAATVTLGSTDAKAGGVHFGILLGYHF